MLTSFLATSSFIIANAGWASAQQSGTSDAYVLGQSVGVAIGVRDGAQRGAQDDISGRTFNPNNYLLPSDEVKCRAYQDLYTIVCDPDSQQYFDFYNGYGSGYQLGFLNGYIAGFYLSIQSLGSLYVQSTGISTSP